MEENLSVFCVLRLCKRLKLRAEKSLRQPNVQSVVWAWLGASIQIYTKNQKQKAELTDIGNFDGGQKGSICKMGQRRA